MENILKTIMAALSASLSYFFGGADVWLVALVTVIVIDYVTGLSKAYIGLAERIKTSRKNMDKRWYFNDIW